MEIIKLCANINLFDTCIPQGLCEACQTITRRKDEGKDGALPMFDFMSIKIKTETCQQKCHCVTCKIGHIKMNERINSVKNCIVDISAVYQINKHLIIQVTVEQGQNQSHLQINKRSHYLNTGLSKIGMKKLVRTANQLSDAKLVSLSFRANFQMAN